MSEDTRSIILRQAEYLIRTRGYSAFSFADLAEAAHIRKASVHHHFRTKEDLIVVLVAEYIERFVATLADVRAQSPDAVTRLRTYARLFADGFEAGMLPLCGALSAERSALPPVMHQTVHDFFQIHVDWLVGVLNDGAAAGTLRFVLPVRQAALLLLNTLEGGSFVGWALSQNSVLLEGFEAALQSLEVKR